MSMTCTNQRGVDELRILHHDMNNVRIYSMENNDFAIVNRKRLNRYRISETGKITVEYVFSD